MTNAPKRASLAAFLRPSASQKHLHCKVSAVLIYEARTPRTCTRVYDIEPEKKAIADVCKPFVQLVG